MYEMDNFGNVESERGMDRLAGKETLPEITKEFYVTWWFNFQ